jgi:hypothetical protein
VRNFVPDGPQVVRKLKRIRADQLVRLENTNYFMELGGERDGTRTHDPLIKSQMLYQLSYALPCGRNGKYRASSPRSIGQSNSLQPTPHRPTPALPLDQVP